MLWNASQSTKKYIRKKRFLLCLYPFSCCTNFSTFLAQKNDILLWMKMGLWLQEYDVNFVPLHYVSGKMRHLGKLWSLELSKAIVFFTTLLWMSWYLVIDSSFSIYFMLPYIHIGKYVGYKESNKNAKLRKELWNIW